MSSLRRVVNREDGFTLSELLVVIALMGMILAVTYNGLRLTSAALGIQERDSYVATSITEPLQIMDVILSQNKGIDAGSGDYFLSCLTDQNADEVFERHVFQATSDGRLTEVVYNVDANDSSVNVSVVRSTVWQRASTDPPARNTNILKSSPLFTYYSRDTSGVITPSAPEGANECVVRIESRYAAAEYFDTRRVLFRNDN